ncbi:LOW QUALITY PROTEIN: pyrin domain-containing protein 5 [Trachypithecus francoisi]|uniref:LOW QUALITY PROTEIN: pyrin domain-containing protein 5 n=1 Tax=Trachypithecus francoisi TaxID=54180 RepID=UPI00141BF015|nr:LOW QUALITY PROTEIN: pyrin domain-containing protein 5 [Trachypithecus francoisi]
MRWRVNIKETLLLTRLDNITDEELDSCKFFLPDEFNIATGKLHTGNSTSSQLDDLKCWPGVCSEEDRIFQKLNYMLVAKCLREEKETGICGSPTSQLRLGLSFHGISGNY